MIIYQGQFNPIILPLRNKMENMNEFFIILCTFHLFCYTDWIPDLEVRANIGLFNAYMISLMMLLNMMIVVYYSVKSLHLIYIKYNNLANYMFNKHIAPIFEKVKLSAQIYKDKIVKGFMKYNQVPIKPND